MCFTATLELTPRIPVFAQQGYFVLMVNPTGSTTFGQGKMPGYGYPNLNLFLWF